LWGHKPSERNGCFFPGWRSGSYVVEIIGRLDEEQQSPPLPMSFRGHCPATATNRLRIDFAFTVMLRRLIY